MSQFEWYTKTTDITFDEFIKSYYEPHYKAKCKSHESIKAKADYFVTLFEGRTLKSIAPSEIEQAIVARTTSQGLSPRTHDYYVAVITRIFNYAKELDFIDKSPVKIKKPAKTNSSHA